MAKYSKGQLTKNHIMKTAQELFYKYGYENTSTRLISKNSDTSLGLISYYFSSKSNIAIDIYNEIRKKRIDMIEAAGYTKFTPFFNLMGAGVQFITLYKNKAYSDFFLKLSSEPDFYKYTYNNVIHALRRYMRKNTSEENYLLACVTLVNMAPAVINAVHDPNNHISLETSLRYYLTQYILLWGEDSGLCEKVINELNMYYIDMVDNFTTIFTKIY